MKSKGIGGDRAKDKQISPEFDAAVRKGETVTTPKRDRDDGEGECEEIRGQEIPNQDEDADRPLSRSKDPPRAENQT